MLVYREASKHTDDLKLYASHPPAPHSGQYMQAAPETPRKDTKPRKLIYINEPRLTCQIPREQGNDINDQE